MHIFDLLSRAISISALGGHICEARARMHEEVVDQGEQRMKRTKVWDHEGFAANKEGVPFLLTLPPSFVHLCKAEASSATCSSELHKRGIGVLVVHCKRKPTDPLARRRRVL